MEDYVAILRCPVCKGSLTDEAPGFSCPACDAFFPLHEGLSDFLPHDASRLKVSEREHYTEKRDYYLEMHEAWCDSPFYRHYHDAFLDELRRLPENSIILELGCGLGRDGIELLRSGYRLVETDIAPGQLTEARRLHVDSGFSDSSVHLLADAENLPFAADSFDGVLIVASLHHLPDPLRFLGEARRVLRPGGIFVLGTEPNSWQHRTIYRVGKYVLRLVYVLMGKEDETVELVSRGDKETEGFSRTELDSLFRRAGFSRWELKPAGYLSAAIFFISTELSNRIGRSIRLFHLERLTIPFDEALGRSALLSRYPWHWNAVAS